MFLLYCVIAPRIVALVVRFNVLCDVQSVSDTPQTLTVKYMIMGGHNKNTNIEF